MEHTSERPASESTPSAAELAALRESEYLAPIRTFLTNWHKKDTGGGDAMLSIALPVLPKLRHSPALGSRAGMVERREKVDATDIALAFHAAAGISSTGIRQEASKLVDRVGRMTPGAASRLRVLPDQERDQAYATITDIPLRDLEAHFVQLAANSPAYNPNAWSDRHNAPRMTRYIE